MTFIVSSIYWGGNQIRGKANVLGCGTGYILDSDPDNFTTKRYSWRILVDANGDRWSYTLNTGNPTLEQTRFDYHLQQMIDGRVGCLDFVWYPTGDLMALGVAGEQQSADIWRAGFDRYMASSLKSQMKFTLILSNSKLSHDGTIAAPSNTWGNLESYADYFVELFQDPQYLTVDGGKPLVYIYDVTGFPDFTATEAAVIDDACTAALIPTPLYVQQNHNLTAPVCTAVSSYGVVSGARPAGSGLKSYATQRAKDRSNWGPFATRKTIVSMTFQCNGEPRAVSVFCDLPMFSDVVKHMQDAIAFAEANPDDVTEPAVGQFYSVTEPDEGGHCGKSAQDNGNEHPVFAGIRAVMDDDIPEQYWDRYTWRSANVAVTRVGFTTYTRDIAGAYEGAENQSAVAGDSVTVTPAQTIDGYEWRGTRGTGRGIAEFYRDGVLVGTEDLYAASNTRNAVLFSETGLTPAVYELKVEVTGEQNPSATGATIGGDELRVHINTSEAQAPEADMGSLSTALLNRGLDHILGVAAYTAPATIELRAYLSGGVEVSGGGYALLEPDNDGTTWSAAASREKANAINLDFVTATGAAWGLVAEIRGFNPDTAEEMFRHTLETPQQIDDGDTLRIAAGALTITAPAGAVSDDVVHSLLDLIFGASAYTAETDVEFAYYDGDPQGAGVEITGTGYARDVLTNNGTTWSAAASGVSRNLIDVSVGTAGAGDWDEATHWALFDAAGTGLIMSAQLPVARTVANGDTETIQIGRIRPTWS